MPKQRDLLDYVSVGAEIAQTAQLSSISSSLDNALLLSAAQAAEQAEHRDQEARRQATEDRIREFVFQGERLISDMRKRGINANPRGALFVASRLQQKIERAGVTTNRVRDYTDKQHVQRLFDAITSFRDDCEKMLSFEDSMTVQSCLEFQAEEEQLLEAIACAKAKETAAVQGRAHAAELEQKQRELDSIRNKRKSRYPVISFIAFCIGLFFIGEAFVKKNPNASWMLLPGGYFCLMCLAGMMRVEKPEAIGLRKEIEFLHQKFAQSDDDANAAQQFAAKFGKRSAAEYEKVLKDRRNAIQKLLNPAGDRTPESETIMAPIGDYSDPSDEKDDEAMRSASTSEPDFPPHLPQHVAPPFKKQIGTGVGLLIIILVSALGIGLLILLGTMSENGR